MYPSSLPVILLIFSDHSRLVVHNMIFEIFANYSDVAIPKFLVIFFKMLKLNTITVIKWHNMGNLYFFTSLAFTFSSNFLFSNKYHNNIINFSSMSINFCCWMEFHNFDYWKEVFALRKTFTWSDSSNEIKLDLDMYSHFTCAYHE